jgi:hypothetical protein
MGDPDAPIAALSALIRERDASTRAHEDLDAFLGGRDLAPEDREALVAVGAKRWMVYRSLVHNRVRNTIREFIERTTARVGVARLKADVTEWLHERAPASPYLRDVPHEFVDWVEPRWRDDPTIPAYIVDLARHELLEYLVLNDPAGGDAPTGEPLALDRPLRFDGAARLVRYDFAVHRLALDEDDRTEPAAEPTELLVYRDAKHKVRYLELTELAAAVLRHLLSRRAPVADGLRAACEELGVALDDERLAVSATLLADLADRGVMLGAETG